MTQQPRNLLMNLEGHADGFKFLIRDRGAKFTAAFDAVFTAVGARIIKTPLQAPRECGRGMLGGSARRECLDRLLINGGRHLRLVLGEYADHCNIHRPSAPCSRTRPSGGCIRLPK